MSDVKPNAQVEITRLLTQLLEEQHPQQPTPVRAQPKVGPPVLTRPRVPVSWRFVAIVGVIVWVGVFGGWTTITGLLTPTTTTTIYQTATAGPTANKLIPTASGLGGQVVVPQLPMSEPAATATPTPTDSGIAANTATADAMYKATAAAADSPQATPTLVVPTPTQALGVGSTTNQGHPSVVDIQATHTCKHGQVWTDSGCRNADGAQSNRHP